MSSLLLTNLQNELEKNTHILKFLVSDYNINLDDVLDNMNKKQREEIFAQHKEKYAVFQDAKDKRWKTSVPDKTKKTGRKLIAKKEYADLVTAVAEFYSAAGLDTEFESLTLRTVFPEWLHYKSVHNSSATARRILNDWNKYYLNDSIIDIPINKLNLYTLDNWIHNLINSNKMTKKQYTNASIIMRQCLNYVCLKYPEHMKSNPFSNIKVNPKIYTYNTKPIDNTQIFTVEEEDRICQLAIERGQQYPVAITALAIALNFQLGLRAGELVSLCWNDIIQEDDNLFIRIQRMQIADFETTDTGEVISKKTKIVNRTKSPAGERSLYLNSKARKILEIIRERNAKLSFTNNGFIFVNMQGKPIGASHINKLLYKYCETLGIPKRSSHKIRKTYLTELFENGVSINEICRIAGHEDEKTFFRNYCFNRRTQTETITLLENISKCKHV